MCSTLAPARKNASRACSKCTPISKTRWKPSAAVTSVPALASKIFAPAILCATKMHPSCSKLWTSPIPCSVLQWNPKLKKTSTVWTKVCKSLLKKTPHSKWNLTRKPDKPLSAVWVSFTSISLSTVCVANLKLSATKVVRKLPTKKPSPNRWNCAKCLKSNPVVAVSLQISSAA